MGGDFYGTFIYNYSDSSHNSYLGAWVVGEPAWIPVANAGPDQIVFNEITLDGLQSTDSDGIIDLYEWQILHRENPAYDRTAVGDKPTISDLEPGFYDVTLTVTDNDGAVDADTMVFSAMGRKGDLNMDGDVDGDDLSEFSEEYGN